MPDIRPLKLPQDLDAYLELLKAGYQYAENPDWSLQADEFEKIFDDLTTIKRWWPVFWALRKISPDMRDSLCGFLSEEGGKAVGILTYQRRRGGQEWYGNYLVVHPEYRRQGIAQSLAMTAMIEGRNRKAEKAILDVVDGNLPAYNLYKNVGFEDCAIYGEYSFDLTAPQAVLPMGYSVATMPISDWRLRYELDQRITPELVKKYAPVVESYYRRPWLLDIFFKLGKIFSKHDSETIVIRTLDTKQVVGIATYHARTRPGGVNLLKVKMDPNHPAIAHFLLADALERLQKAGKGQRVRFQIPSWQPALVEAAEAMGAKKLASMRRMGLEVVY